MSDITEPQSPCVDVCELDSSNDVCSGCYRTLDEISIWPNASKEEKKQIIERSAMRKSNNAKDINITDAC